MVDTIVLTLKQNMYTITDHDRFEPSTRSLFDESLRMGGRGYATYKQNPTPAELKNGIYKPRLTVTRRFNDGVLERMMKVEFSAPKLLYKNNFDEIEDKDFDNLIDTLQKTMKGMGVLIFWQVLASAPVSSIHYSKNVELLDGLTSFTVLKEIQKANVTQRLDFNQSDFRNEGHSVKYHTNSFEIAFYDKVKDLQQSKISEKRAIERDNILQMNLFEEVKKSRKDKLFEVLRMEIRLNQRQKIRQVLKILGYNTEPTIRNLFKIEIAQKVLLYYLSEIEKGYPKALYFEPKSNKDFYAQFMIDNPKANIKEAVLAFGFRKTLEEMTTRELKEQYKRKPKGSWYNFIAQLNGYNYPKNALDVFKPIRDSIKEFKPLKLVDFQDKMINNDKYT